jgi:phosphohistidine phosphatase
VEILPELYGADPAQLLQAIHAACAADPQRLMLVGHNPGMHELALALTGGGDAAGHKALSENLPTSGLAVFDFAVDDWADVAFRRGRLVQFLSPKLLKQGSDD